jgi:hypothetical protein
MTVVLMVIVTMVLANAMKDMRVKTVQKLLDLKRDAQNLVSLNVYNFVLMFIKLKVSLPLSNAILHVTKNALETVLQQTKIQERQSLLWHS